MDSISKSRSEITGNLEIVFGDVVLGVHGDGFEYLFSYQMGGLESLVVKGREWLYRTPKPTFWRATTDNDRGSGFSLLSAMWMGADLFLRTTDIRVWVDEQEFADFLPPGNNRFGQALVAESLKIVFVYETATVPKTKVETQYTVDQTGRIRVDVHYYGKRNLPQLPVFGMRFIMPTKADGYSYTGLSGETYPDRMAGGVEGEWEVTGLPVTPYLVPQDCGMHMDTKRLTVRRSSVLANDQRGEISPFSLTFEKAEESFAFSCLPYTAEELENATHQEELPPARRTVVCILGAVRGVGGIDSWGSDVEEAYHLNAEKDIRYAFYIVPE